ncbi:type II secretion system pilot lipoprotein GspS [Erwinia mallotivora]|uniref:type II secretion system pilot lipoprotein GspS n=1 Tax=Erwinia mallotivora TaxID=69222 RepID=UPI0021BF1827|nr:type II secretion system pilot lipoprotein GspS [Erwinia mallotivora]
MNVASISALILLPLLITGCQNKASQEVSSAASDTHSRQVAAVIAGTRYLKYQCGDTALPSEKETEEAARAEACQRGWQLADDLLPLSEALYQQLQQNSLTPAEQCAELREALQPFLTTLPPA